MNRKKLMHIVFSLDRGGAERVVFDLVSKLNDQKIDSSVCCLTQEGFFSNELNRKGIKTYYFNKSDGVDYFLPFKLAHMLKKENIDIIHIHDNSTILYGTLAAKLAKIPSIVYTEHGGFYFETKRK